MRIVFTLLLSVWTVLSFGQKADIENVVNQTLDIISVAPGETPDWESFRTLFAPNATVVVRYKPANSDQKLLTWSVEDFIQKAGPNYEKQGFSEKPLKTQVMEFNGVSTVFQSYEAVLPNRQMQGVNTYQLVELNGEWKIISMTWAEATPETPLPRKWK